MASLCALDWRHGLVVTTVTADASGGVRLALGHGPDELVLHVAWDTLDTLIWAALTGSRPEGARPWPLALLRAD